MTENNSRDPVGLRRAGSAFNLSGRLGQYAALMYGVYTINQENINIKKIVLSGVAFGVFSFIEYLSCLAAYRAEGEIIRETTNELKDKINHLERKISGKSISSRILDPNKPDDRTKLDEIVERNLREAEKKDKKSRSY